MEKYAADLAKLKELLQTADDFADIVTFFFDHLCIDRRFIDDSTPVKHPLIKPALRTIAAELFKRDPVAPTSDKGEAINDMVLLKLRKYLFYHGACFILGRPVSVLYFEDIDTGVVCTASAFPHMQFARFTCYRGKDLDPNIIPTAGNRSIH
jgi:hypothetical protein